MPLGLPHSLTDHQGLGPCQESLVLRVTTGLHQGAMSHPAQKLHSSRTGSGKVLRIMWRSLFVCASFCVCLCVFVCERDKETETEMERD